MRLDAHPFKQTVSVSVTAGAAPVKLPRCQTVAITVKDTSSLALTIKTSYEEGSPDPKNARVQSLTSGLIYFPGETITVTAGDTLVLPAAGLDSITFVPSVGSGTLFVRASEYAIVTNIESCKVFSFIADATDELLIKSTPGIVYGMTAFTIDATPVYVKMYNKASAPSEADTPAYRMGTPANSTAALGSGNNHTLPRPVYHSTGIGVRAVVGLADADDTALTATENLINIFYN